MKANILNKIIQIYTSMTKENVCNNFLEISYMVIDKIYNAQLRRRFQTLLHFLIYYMWDHHPAARVQ